MWTPFRVRCCLTTAEDSGYAGRGILDSRAVAGEVGRRQSIGRSALIAAAILMAAGTDPETAVATIERARGLRVPETDEQMRWTTGFADWLARARAAQPTATAGGLRRRLSG